MNYLHMNAETELFVTIMDSGLQTKLRKEYQERLDKSFLKNKVKKIKILGNWHSVHNGTILKAPEWNERGFLEK